MKIDRMQALRTIKAISIVGAIGVIFTGMLHCNRDRHAPKADSNETAVPSEEPAKSTGEREVVVFAVLDMVRSDHLAICGYNRPTSRTLEKLRDMGAVSTCAAYAPGTWTLPSHASFFTGEPVPAHRAGHCMKKPKNRETITWKGNPNLPGNPMLPLGPQLPTLAEKMQAAGFQTALVSANPVVSKWSKTGLDRGFEAVEETRKWGALYGDPLVTAVNRVLDTAIDPSRSLFLFVNIADAHTPWEPIPDDLGWLPRREGLDVGNWEERNPFVRFMKGKMTGKESKRFVEQITDLYDFGVFRADHTLGKLVDLLYSRGLLDRRFRLVVTSDHGEFLGEHGLIHHFTFAYEPDVKVPLLYWTDDRKALRPLPEPISALTAHDLVRHGRLPARPRPIQSTGEPSVMMVSLFGKRVFKTTAAQWSGSEKLFWMDGQYLKTDLAKDPAEAAWQPLEPDHPGRSEFEQFVSRVRAAEPPDAVPTPEMIEALRALGYTE